MPKISAMTKRIPQTTALPNTRAIPAAIRITDLTSEM